MSARWVLLLIVPVVAVSGCATLPSGPSVMVLPGPGKTLEQFQADDTFCRQWAWQQAAKTVAGEMYGSIVQWRYDMPYQQCMYAKGHQIPGAPALNAIPPPPATTLPSPPTTGGPAPPPQAR
jgi:hypothetical protein